MAQSEAFWDKRSKTYDDNVGKPNPAREQRVARTKALLGESHVVPDFGCATGEMSLAIAPDVYQIQGIDLSREMIMAARRKTAERGIDNVRFDQMAAFDHRLDHNSFTAVIAFNVFHLVEDPQKVKDTRHWMVFLLSQRMSLLIQSTRRPG